MKAIITIIKENGSKEPFSLDKVKNALKRSGLGPKECEAALKMLYPKLKDGMSTKAIYSHVYRIIRELSPESSHRYNLKRALLMLGPAGFFFEDFVGKLFSALGYEISVREIPMGKCITHEVDVIAWKGNEKVMVECKFRNEPGSRCRVQTALYVYARFLDLKDGAKIYSKIPFTSACLVTNAKFSGDVIAYADCVGMKLIGWRHPAKDSLEELIDQTKCYPISVINMNSHTLALLMKKGIATVKDLPATPKELSELTGISPSNAARIMEEAELVLK